MRIHDQESGTEGPLRLVVLGGGNGIAAALRGLAGLRTSGFPLDITAVVTAADDGGSSGRLRKERGGPPPGDVRNCLLSLAPDGTDTLKGIFSHRYRGNGSLGGHTVGNLILSALAEKEGCFLKGVEVAERLLGCVGRVLPASLESLHLEGETVDGGRLRGESRIGNAPCAIRRIRLEPSTPEAAPGVPERIRKAHGVVIGPGSLFTSLLPVLLVPAVGRAVRDCPGRRILVANLMTQPGETLGMNLADHLDALDRHAGRGVLTDILLNTNAVDATRVEPYGSRGSEPVSPSGCSGRPEQTIWADIVTPSGKIRHDPVRLANALVRISSPQPDRLPHLESSVMGERESAGDGLANY